VVAFLLLCTSFLSVSGGARSAFPFQKRNFVKSVRILWRKGLNFTLPSRLKERLIMSSILGVFFSPVFFEGSRFGPVYTVGEG